MRRVGYTDELNALLPEDEYERELSRALSAVDQAEFVEILQEVAPGNPFAESLLAAKLGAKPTKNPSQSGITA